MTPCRPAWLVCLLGVVGPALRPEPVSAQLISPGKLSTGHASLEGIRNCTRCHELRQKGVSADLCLDCHEPLARRYAAGTGFHATLSEKDCAACHKEHFGVDFAIVRLDTADFQHDRTGYDLEGAHTDLGCRDCHSPDRVTDPTVMAFASEHGGLERTFLGLPDTCGACHDPDSPHGEDLEGRPCASCHDQDGWDDAPRFDHAGTNYPLTGLHARVACAGCHRPRGAGPDAPLRYTGIEAGSCSSCHADPHSGAMPGRCERCHTTRGWRSVDRRRVESDFDHRRTGFNLVGRHAEAPCASCHDARASSGIEGVSVRFQKGTARRAFPHPVATTCASCHVDRHESLPLGEESPSSCDACHGQETWLPSDYDLARHQREAAYALVGAHLAVACESCHRSADGTLRFRVEAGSCTDCHRDSSPHGDQFDGRTCDACHVGDSFLIEAFDHDSTRFALDGAHRSVPCASCHLGEARSDGTLQVRYRPLGTECRDCHGGVA